MASNRAPTSSVEWYNQTQMILIGTSLQGKRLPRVQALVPLAWDSIMCILKRLTEMKTRVPGTLSITINLLCVCLNSFIKKYTYNIGSLHNNVAKSHACATMRYVQFVHNVKKNQK